MMLWVKAFHIIFVITWFAALFYLPRLFVYHCQSTDEISIDRFKVMERKLLMYIMNPSAIFATTFGVWSMYFSLNYYLSAGWMHAKIFLVLALIVFHLMCFYHFIQFKHNKNNKTAKYFKIFNEIPSIILIAVVILVVVKPF